MTQRELLPARGFGGSGLAAAAPTTSAFCIFTPCITVWLNSSAISCSPKPQDPRTSTVRCQCLDYRWQDVAYL